MPNEISILATNKTRLRGYKAHTDQVFRLKLKSVTGGDGFKVILSGSSTESLVISTIFISSPSLGNKQSGLNTTIENICIPADKKEIDLTFINKQRLALEGTHNNIEYTVTLQDLLGNPIATDTVTLARCRNYSDLGSSGTLSRVMQGSGKIFKDYQELGFYEETGIKVTPTGETIDIRPGNVAGSVGTAKIHYEYMIEFSLMEATLENFLFANNLIGTVTQSDNITAFGGTRSGQYIDLKPETGILDQFSLQVEGHSITQDNKDMGWDYPLCSVVESGEHLIGKGNQLLIPVKVKAYTDAHPDVRTIGRQYLMDPR